MTRFKCKKISYADGTVRYGVTQLALGFIPHDVTNYFYSEEEAIAFIKNRTITKVEPFIIEIH